MLPGLVDRLADSPGSTPLLLEEGAPARGVLCERARIESDAEPLPFVTRLPSPLGGGSASAVAAKATTEAPTTRPGRHPSHVLHDGVAVPIGEEPLLVGTAPPEGRRGLTLEGRPPGVSRSHCALVRRGGVVFVEDHSSYGSFLNEQRIEGSTELRARDRLRLGAPGVELLLIAVEPS